VCLCASLCVCVCMCVCSCVCAWERKCVYMIHAIWSVRVQSFNASCVGIYFHFRLMHVVCFVGIYFHFCIMQAVYCVGIYFHFRSIQVVCVWAFTFAFPLSATQQFHCRTTLYSSLLHSATCSVSFPCTLRPDVHWQNGNSATRSVPFPCTRRPDAHWQNRRVCLSHGLGDKRICCTTC